MHAKSLPRPERLAVLLSIGVTGGADNCFVNLCWYSNAEAMGLGGLTRVTGGLVTPTHDVNLVALAYRVVGDFGGVGGSPVVPRVLFRKLLWTQVTGVLIPVPVKLVRGRPVSFWVASFAASVVLAIFHASPGNLWWTVGLQADMNEVGALGVRSGHPQSCLRGLGGGWIPGVGPRELATHTGELGVDVRRRHSWERMTLQSRNSRQEK